MQVEYEATFPNIDKNEIREKLKNVGAKLIKPEFLQKRTVFFMPKGHEIKGGWVRVRDENDKITMTLKVIDGDKIENQKEINLKVNDFLEAQKLLEAIGCKKKSYQETKREIWMLDEVEICVDEWPFLNPFIEIEGKNEEEVKKVSEKIGFNYQDALFCGVATLYSKQYGIPYDFVNDQVPEIIFEGKNPFLK